MVPQRIAAVLAVAILAFTTSLPASAQIDQACTNREEGTLLVPLFTNSPPSHLAMVSPKVNSFLDPPAFLHVAWIDVTDETQFYFWPSASSTVAGQRMPDFYLQFYRTSGNTEDPVESTIRAPAEGTVPNLADRALIWMRTGPDVPPGDGKVFGAEFNYADFCTNTPPGYP